MADETKPKEIILVTSLNQLGSQKIQIEIEDEESVMVIPAHTLTHSQWVQCERDVVKPKPAEFAGPKGVIYNTDDPQYKQDVADYWQNVSYLRVVRALDLHIDGADENAKIVNLRNTIGVQAMNAVLGGLIDAHQGRRARIKARAETFQRDGDIHPQDMQTAELAAG